MKLISWNVNGIRAAYKKGLLEFVERQNPDVFCVQETKAHLEQVEPAVVNLGGLSGYWSSATRRGYSGVASFFKHAPKKVEYGVGISEYDSEGRFVVSHHEAFSLYNIYFPNGGSGEERHQFKQKFLKDLNLHLKPIVQSGRQVIVTGDYNVAHRDIDIYDPKKLANESGFLPVERQWFDSFLELGFVDTFRYMHPEVRDKYTWWSYLEGGRMHNRGWRIDYFCVTEGLAKSIRRAEVLDQQEGSDHCPVLLDIQI